jgi:hypothetical protein
MVPIFSNHLICAESKKKQVQSRENKFKAGESEFKAG